VSTPKTFETDLGHELTLRPEDVFSYARCVLGVGTVLTTQDGKLHRVLEPFSTFHRWVIHPTLAGTEPAPPANTTAVKAPKKTKRKA
jgi:hypothetical protein